MSMYHSKRRDQPQGKGQPTHKVEGVLPSGEHTMYPVIEQQASSTPLKTTFFKARTVPFALRQKVKAELDRFEKEGVIKPVQFSDWAAPIVPVIKRDATVWIWGDYKLALNKAAKLEVYLLPCVEDLLASLAGGKTFTNLDLSHTYLQVKLDEESMKYATVNTHRALFQY